ncbi:serine/threonine-protein kinase/endoribonuclease IRE1, partial [Tanacetum coccineum]
MVHLITTWDGRGAIVKKVKRRDDLEETKYMIRMIQMSGYHKNLVNFYRWETDGEFEFFAFEECGVTLHKYVKQHTYKEMSETTLKIMSGLAEGVKHLHTRGIAHLDLNPHNILVNSDGTIKICGSGNNGQLLDQHNLAHIILYIISNGQHDVEDVDVVPETFNDRILNSAYISSLQLQGTNQEALDLFKKLGILNISDHLKEGKPTQQLVTDLQNLLLVVVPSGSWFQVFGGTETGTVLEAVGYTVSTTGPA